MIQLIPEQILSESGEKKKHQTPKPDSGMAACASTSWGSEMIGEAGNNNGIYTKAHTSEAIP